MLYLIQVLLKCLAALATAAAANAYSLIPVVFVIAAFLALRWYYLKTSRDVKRLEAVGEHLPVKVSRFTKSQKKNNTHK